MEYRLLGHPIVGEVPHYRGTYRCEPMVLANYPLDHPVNSAAIRYMELAPDGLNRHTALELASVLARYDMLYDVVTIETTGDIDSQRNTLGFDVSVGSHYSLLCNGLRWAGQTEAPSLIRVIYNYFEEKLNKHSLFEHWDKAELFRQVVIDSSPCYPGFFESDNILREFKVTRINLIVSGQHRSLV